MPENEKKTMILRLVVGAALVVAPLLVILVIGYLR